VTISVSATTPSTITPTVTSSPITATATNGSVVSVTASETSAAITVTVSGGLTVTATGGSTVAVAVSSPSTVSVSVTSGLSDAPSDGSTYGRKDGAWAVVTTTETDPIYSASEAASFVAGDAAKLAGIEAGAEVNNISDLNATDLTDGGSTTLHTHAGESASDILTKLLTVDGAGSGLDADLLDGNHASAFLTAESDPVWVAFRDTVRTAGTFYGGPAAGSPAIPEFRALVAADIPVISISSLPSGAQQYQVLTTGATPFAPVYSGYLLDGTTGGKTVFAVTNTKTLTLTAADSYNATFPQTGTVAMLQAANVFTTTQTITPATDVVGLIINKSTTADFLQAKSGATIYSGIDNSGRVFSYGGAGITTNALIQTLPQYSSTNIQWQIRHKYLRKRHLLRYFDHPKKS